MNLSHALEAIMESYSEEDVLTAVGEALQNRLDKCDYKLHIERHRKLTDAATKVFCARNVMREN